MSPVAIGISLMSVVARASDVASRDEAGTEWGGRGED